MSFESKVLGQSKQHDLSRACPTIVTVMDIINASLDGVLVPYGKNRGDVGVDQKFIDRLKTAYVPGAIGEFTVMFKDGIFYSADANTRIMLLCQLYSEQKLSREDLSDRVCAKLIPEKDFLIIYGALNTSRPHRGKEKISNSDFFWVIFGKRWKVEQFFR